MLTMLYKYSKLCTLSAACLPPPPHPNKTLLAFIVSRTSPQKEVVGFSRQQYACTGDYAYEYALSLLHFPKMSTAV